MATAFDGALNTSALIVVTAPRVLIFPQRLARRVGVTLEPAIVDWPRGPACRPPASSSCARSGPA